MATQFLRLVTLLCFTFSLRPAAAAPSQSTLQCRNIPGDAGWPSLADWNQLNKTVGGNLIQGIPLAQPCYTGGFGSSSCKQIRSEWTALEPYLENPVNVMSPYWTNNTCSPFKNGSTPMTCTLGNLASYAINVTNVSSVIAGIHFAQAKNIRLTIKNTGHDFLGRSTGKGALALWTTHLKEVTPLNYSSTQYRGPALRIGAGIQTSEIYDAADRYGLRVSGGSCPTVGMTGGFIQGGGHGPLAAAYGLGSDQTLEFDVVTAAGQHLTASPTQNSDLYWALSGGGAGNYAVVMSATIKAHKDGPIVGATLGYKTTDTEAHWKAVSAWLKQLLTLNAIPGFGTLFAITSDEFLLEYTTLPGGTAADMTRALSPFTRVLESLNLSLSTNTTKVLPSFKSYYSAFATQSYDTNNSIGGRLIPSSVVQSNPAPLLDVFKSIVTSSLVKDAVISGISANVSYARTGKTPGSNAVLPAWRDSLFTMTIGVPLAENASWATIDTAQGWLNARQGDLGNVTPGSGTYENEATFDNPDWKRDYFGGNYDALKGIKDKWDSQSLFWVAAGVGSEVWRMQGDGRLCRTAAQPPAYS